MNKNTSRIAKNTFALYLRMLLSLFVSLFTSRVVLNALGFEDYGIHNVVGGIIVLFSFLNGALAGGTQRFLTFELGKRDYIQLKKVFNMSVNIHVLLAIIILLLSQTIGLWFLNHKLVIPENRIQAANWVYQFAVITSIFSIIQVPYIASVTSHEKFKIYALTDIVKVFFKLLIAVLLVYVTNMDKLIFFSSLNTVVAFGVFLFYKMYSKKQFNECTYHYIWDKELFKTLSSFSSWALLGGSSHILMTQGMNILINLFFGVTVNAARGITVQLGHAITSFVDSFMTAIKPQIIKNYASGDFKTLSKLVFQGAKFSFLIVLIFTLPIFIEIEIILSLWLKNIPNYTIVFIRLNLIVIQIYSFTNTYLTAITATGKIRSYQSYIALFVFILFSITYYLLKKGFPPETTYFIYIIIAFVVMLLRIIHVQKLIGFKIWDFMKNVLTKGLLIFILSLITPTLIYFYLEQSIIRLGFVTFSSFVSIILFSYLFAITKGEKEIVMKYIRNKIRI